VSLKRARSTATWGRQTCCSIWTEARPNGASQHGDKILLFGQESGMSVGALLLRWHGLGGTPPQRPAKIGTT
jgi:hypothetical protein